MTQKCAAAAPKAKQHCCVHHLGTTFMKSWLTLSERYVHYERESEAGLARKTPLQQGINGLL